MAERYEAGKPVWLDVENPDWQGNYKVQYWHPEWQAIIFGSVMASYCVEKFSLDRLRELTFTEIELRYKEFKEFTKF